MSETTQPKPGSVAGREAASMKPPVVVKKYANRRLYNTESSSYITLETLADMIRVGRDFVVYDAKTGDDITRSVLTQIIVDEESKGRAMLPTGFLRQLIGFYGDSVQTLVPRYLEQAMTTFARQQEHVRIAMQQTIGNFLPFGIEEASRQNLAMMERAMSLFTPFHRENDAGAASPSPAGAPVPASTSNPASEAPSEPAARDRELALLRAEVQALREQLARSQDAGATTGAGAVADPRIAAAAVQSPATLASPVTAPVAPLSVGPISSGTIAAAAVTARATGKRGPKL